MLSGLLRGTAYTREALGGEGPPSPSVTVPLAVIFSYNGVEGVLIPSDPRPENELQRWLASRLSSGAEPSESGTDRAGGLGSGDGVGIFGMRPLHLPARRAPSEDDDDPATVADRSRQKPIPTVHDDPTVQLSPGQLAFLREESAQDPETVFDQRPNVARWRAELEAERPPARLPQASGSEGGTTTLSRTPLPDDLPASSSLWDAWLGSRALALLPLAIGAISGLIFLLIVIAIWAGSP